MALSRLCALVITLAFFSDALAADSTGVSLRTYVPSASFVLANIPVWFNANNGNQTYYTVNLNTNGLHCPVGMSVNIEASFNTAMPANLNCKLVNFQIFPTGGLIATASGYNIDYWVLTQQDGCNYQGRGSANFELICVPPNGMGGGSGFSSP